MKSKTKTQYLRNATRLGWGEGSAKLDTERVALMNKFCKGKKILDVGCGFGVYVDYLSQKGFDAYGVDFTPEFIKKAKIGKKGKFILGRAQKLQFADNFFDTTILFDILEHGDDKKILKEAKRVTKSRIIIIVPNEVDESLSNTGVVYRHYIDKTHLKEYNPEMIKVLAHNLNLKLSYLSPVHPLNNKIIFLGLFGGPTLLKDIIRKIVFSILPLKLFPTELFAVFDK